MNIMENGSPNIITTTTSALGNNSYHNSYYIFTSPFLANSSYCQENSYSGNIHPQYERLQQPKLPPQSSKPHSHNQSYRLNHESLTPITKAPPQSRKPHSHNQSYRPNHQSLTLITKAPPQSSKYRSIITKSFPCPKISTPNAFFPEN